MELLFKLLSKGTSSFRKNFFKKKLLSEKKFPFKTSSVAIAGTTDPSGGPGRLRYSGAEGGFSLKALSVSQS